MATFHRWEIDPPADCPQWQRSTFALVSPVAAVEVGLALGSAEPRGMARGEQLWHAMCPWPIQGDTQHPAAAVDWWYEPDLPSQPLMHLDQAG
jgi:hypothetical protein